MAEMHKPYSNQSIENVR